MRYGSAMTNTILADAFGHHTWATLVLLDVCADLTEEQLATTVPGTYGSLIGTLATRSRPMPATSTCSRRAR